MCKAINNSAGVIGDVCGTPLSLLCVPRSLLNTYSNTIKFCTFDILALTKNYSRVNFEIKIFTSLTTIGFNFISLGRAAITSFLVKPFKTGIRNLTSETLV